MGRVKIDAEIQGVHSEEIFLEEPFIDIAARFAGERGTVLLLSGGNLDCAKYHILGLKPWLTLQSRQQDSCLSLGDNDYHYKGDPLGIIRQITDKYRIDGIDKTVPIEAGLMGYLAYDLKDSIEKIPRTSVDDLGLPHICLYAPSILLIHDKEDNRTFLKIVKRVQGGELCFQEDLEYFKESINPKIAPSGYFELGAGGLHSNLSRSEYMESVERIKNYIVSGDVYQVNMSQRFETGFRGDPFQMFRTLYEMNPAPFFAYINAGDHQILSTSPERFIKRDGASVEARPIKGTSPRGKTDEEDQRFREELKNSIKDDAELSMIVDLLRNDIGKVCRAGSVRVTEHKRMEAYENVYHLVSRVEGRLALEFDTIDIIKATFPGGSITGCPKIRSMEIIDELESRRRHIYTGSIGYLSFHDTMDLSIAIRTATVINGRIIFSVGGGIVYDSDPYDEYDETIHKGRTFMEVLRVNGKEGDRVEKVWINGVLKSGDGAYVKISDLGFQYGYGFFETIRVEKGKVHYLEEHLDRFNSTWKELFKYDPPDLTWENIISSVLQINGLENTVAAVKIMASRGSRSTVPYDHTLIVSARSYRHRLEDKYEKGLNLTVHPSPRHTPLADHKTMNYLYYFLAGNRAREQGADEALIINPDGTVSETNSANILFVKDKTVYKPKSSHVLKGVMESHVCRVLSQWGYEIVEKEIYPQDIGEYDHVFLTNSLIGVVPVLRLDGKQVGRLSDLVDRINSEIKKGQY